MSSRNSLDADQIGAQRDRKQVSLMHVFRSAVERGDSRDGRTTYRDGDREVTQRSKERREGTDEETLRRHLSNDMASLMNTIALDAIVEWQRAYLRQADMFSLTLRQIKSYMRRAKFGDE